MAVDGRVARTNTTIRNAARIGGVVLLVAGLVVFIHFGARVVHDISRGDDMNSPDFATGPSIGTILATMGGFLLIGISLQLLNIGFLRTAADYIAGEGSTALRSVAGDIGAGLRGDAGKTGAYCPKCGTRGAAGASFCDHCGTALPEV